MIFVTVGTTSFPFHRMDDVVQRVGEQFKKEKVIYQSLTTGLESKKYLRVVSEIPYGSFVKFIKMSRVVVSHGGPATIYHALRYGKNIPIVIPRKKSFGEHVDDHQVYFIEYLLQKNLIFVPKAEGDFFYQDIFKYLHNPKRNIFNSRKDVAGNKLTQELTKYVNSSFED